MKKIIFLSALVFLFSQKLFAENEPVVLLCPDTLFDSSVDEIGIAFYVYVKGCESVNNPGMITKLKEEKEKSLLFLEFIMREQIIDDVRILQFGNFGTVKKVSQYEFEQRYDLFIKNNPGIKLLVRAKIESKIPASYFLKIFYRDPDTIAKLKK